MLSGLTEKKKKPNTQNLKVGEGAYMIKINGNISIYFDT